MSSIRLLKIALLTCIAVSGLHAQSASLTVPGDANGVVLQAGAEAVLTVRASDPSGAPLAGASIVFTSPAAGPRGVFPDSAATGQSYLRATTDAEGIAEARFRADFQVGPAPIEALLESADVATSFAINIIAPPSSPLADPAAVRRAVLDAMTPGAESPDLRIHGPFWLPAGSTILPAERWAVFNLEVPIALSADSWVLWIDEQPGAQFAHGVRYVVLPDGGGSPASIMESAKVAGAEWWPEAYLPLSIEPISLFGPTASNEQLAADAITPNAQLAPETVYAAPANACAISIYGPELTGAKIDTEAFRDYLIRAEKVAPENIKLNEQPFGNGSFNRTATKEDFKRLVDEAAAAGCTKLYLLIRAHGSRGVGAGVQLRDPMGGGKILPYSELVEILAPFRGKTVCALTDSCYSGQFILWLEGQGIRGEAISSGDLDHVTWTSNRGALFFRAWLAALENTDADQDGGGVSFVEAHQYVVANSTDTKLTDAMPLGGVINPNGTRRLELPDVKIYNEGETRILTLARPPGTDLMRPFTVDLSALGPSIATFPAQVVIPPFTNVLPVPVTGVDCGVMDYQASGSDGVHSYIGRAKIQVNDFKVIPDPIIIAAPGVSLTVTVMRFGYYSTVDDNESMLTITPRDPTVATPSAAIIPVANGQLLIPFSVSGLKPGETIFDIRDQRSYGRKSVKVIVLGAPSPPPTGCPTSGTSQISTSVSSGRQHIDFTGNPPNATLTLLVNGETVTISTNRNQFPPATGRFNATDCTFTAEGVAQQPVAGFPNVKGDYTGSIVGAEFSRLNVRIRIGTGGEFPDGQPVIWDAVGPFTRDDAPSGTGGPLTPGEQTISWAGGPGWFVYAPPGSGEWSATTNADWIMLESPATGNGPGQIDFLVAANSSSSPREGAIMLGSEQFLIHQDGTDNPRPVLHPGGVLNGMTFQPGTAHNTWTTLAGRFPVPATRSWDDPDFDGVFLPTALDGFEVTADGIPMGFYYTSPTQLNVLNNDTGHLGLNAFQVNGPTGSSDPVFAYRREYEPELFRFNPQGGRYVAAIHPNGDLLAPPELFDTFPTTGGAPGGTMTIFGSGFGDTNPPTSAAELIPQPTLLKDQPVFLIGGYLARTRYAGRVSSGFEQFNIDFPPQLGPGEHRIEGFVNGRPLQTEAYTYIGGEIVDDEEQ